MEDNPASDAQQKSAETQGANPTWDRVLLARHPKRPHTLDYINRIFTGFQELHGDRAFGHDAAIVGVMAFFAERPVMVIGHQKGRDTNQKLHRTFGMPKPKRYPKPMRLIRIADKFPRPILTFPNT